MNVFIPKQKGFCTLPQGCRAEGWGWFMLGRRKPGVEELCSRLSVPIFGSPEVIARGWRGYRSCLGSHTERLSEEGISRFARKNSYLLSDVCLSALQPGGFTIEISNNNSTMVMTGMRIQIGTQAIERAPSYIEIFGRTMQLNLSRSRWFDFPFTREEALQADKKLNLFSESLAPGTDCVLLVMAADRGHFPWAPQYPGNPVPR